MKVRFAPSPTGYLHVGNCRTALINWLFARHNDGKFLMRLDDTDLERSHNKYVEALSEDWAWLGLDFDEFEKQSDRLNRYSQIIETLKKDGRLYACYETPEELKYKRKVCLNAGKPPIYDREGLRLTQDKVKAYEAEGRKPHWRFLLSEDPADWDDLIRGPVHFEGSNLSDPILIREDGSPVYTLASVVDDVDFGVTHIIRGEDHVANTAIQIQLIEAIGGDAKKFTFAHLALIAGSEGEGLSKRFGSLSLRELRKEGILPMALISYLSKIGTSDPIQPFYDMQSVIESFDINKFARATSKFSMDQLHLLNKKILHELSFEQALENIDLPDMDHEFWQIVRANLDNLNDIHDWWNICRGNVTAKVCGEDIDFIRTAIDLLPQGTWQENSWEIWVDNLKKGTDRKGKALFKPLRQSLTGQDHGPELKILIQLMGPKLVKERLYQSIED
jgi:glutamyl-tRNA synthetase